MEMILIPINYIEIVVIIIIEFPEVMKGLFVFSCSGLIYPGRLFHASQVLSTSK